MRPAKKLTFEDVWAGLMENREQMKDTDRRIKETDRQMKETDRQMKETDRQMKEIFKRIGDLGNRFGELAEHLVAPSIKEKFKALGYTFEEVSHNKTLSHNGNFLTEVDIVLENQSLVIAVEVKAKPLEKDVDEHVERMEILRRRADARNDTRKFRGAIAGALPHN